MRETQQLYIKPRIITGQNALGFLENTITGRVGIITDAFMVRSGMIEVVLARLSGCTVEIFSEVTPDPSVEMVLQGTNMLASFRPETVIALGGGSPIDAAKAIVSSLRGLEPGRKITFIAIPTTSGTGSEVTEYAIITDTKRAVKLPLRSEDLTPDTALLDPDLTKSLPPSITADTGMDVITHSLEAYVAAGANDFSDAFVEKALSLACVWLPVAYAEGTNIEAREKMHVASCMAGMAFNAAGLGLCHGMAHAVGAMMHIPHGRINAMLLPHVVEFNAQLDVSFSQRKNNPVAERYGMLTRRLGREVSSLRQGVLGLVKEIRRLNTLMQIPATLKEAGLDMTIFDMHRNAMVEAALADATTASNPRKATAANVGRILDLVGGKHGQRW